MNLKDLGNELKALGVPVAMHCFARGKAPQLPYIIYYRDRSSNFRADNQTYHRRHDVSVELYTARKDEALEDQIRGIFEKHGFDYEETEAFLPEEMMVEVLFESMIY